MSNRALPVLFPSMRDQRWSCHSCGRCCYDLVGHLSRAEKERIDRAGWRDRLGVAPYVRLGRGFVLNKHANGACVFLDEDTKLCRIHAEFGEAEKPLACRIYPFTVRAVPDGWQASLRFDCPSLARSQGAAVASHVPAVRAMVAGLPHEGATGDDCPPLVPGQWANPAETRGAVERFCGHVRDGSVPLRQRLMSAAWASTTLLDADLEDVRDERFLELVDMLLGSAGGMVSRQAWERPTARQAGLLRQLVFATSEHATIAEMRSGWFSKAAHRWRQLRKASRFRRGQGRVPVVRGFDVQPAFEAVGVIEPVAAGPEADQVDELIVRYVVHRLATRSVFGYGYYGWPMFVGLGAFWASMAVWGYLARVHAAGCGRGALTFDDVFEALRIVDRSSGRSPALRGRTERMRLKYLMRDQGLVRLLSAYALT